MSYNLNEPIKTGLKIGIVTKIYCLLKKFKIDQNFIDVLLFRQEVKTLTGFGTVAVMAMCDILERICWYQNDVKSTVHKQDTVHVCAYYVL